MYTVESVIASLPRTAKEALCFKNDMPHRSWYYKFLNQHPVISIKKAEYLSACRATVTEERIRGWFTHVDSLLAKEGLKDAVNDPKRIFNCDETAVWLNPTGT